MCLRITGASFMWAAFLLFGYHGMATGAETSANFPVMATVTGNTVQMSWPALSGEGTKYLLSRAQDGEYTYTAIGKHFTETELTLESEHFELNARYKIQACNEVTCTDSEEIRVTGLTDNLIGYIRAANAEPGDRFGSSVALSGDGKTLAVEASWEDGGAIGVNGDASDNSAPDSGAVYIFVRSASGWSQQAYIKASNAQRADRFGTSLALSHHGDTLVVGAPKEDGAEGKNGNSALESGAVYVFNRTGDTWSEQAYLKAPNADAGDRFGHTVAVSANGNVLAVGAPGEDSAATGVDGNGSDNSAEDAGSAYLFARSGGKWERHAYLKASNSRARDHFGQALALSSDGKTVAVGARDEDSSARDVNGDQSDDSQARSGAAYLFALTSSGWLQQAYLKSFNSEYVGLFGSALALSGNGDTLVVGATHEDKDERVSGSLIRYRDSGAVYVFRRSGARWSGDVSLRATQPGDYNYFGASVALSDDGNTLAVGEYGNDSGASGIGGKQDDISALLSGAAYLFSYKEARWGQWSQQAFIKATNPGTQDNFGRSVALSAAGDTLAVGAVKEDGPNDSAVESGAVYLY